MIDDRQRRMDTFLRGLLSGALVGAVIAGSTIWQRRRRRSVAPSPHGSDETNEPGTASEGAGVSQPVRGGSAASVAGARPAAGEPSSRP